MSQDRTDLPVEGKVADDGGRGPLDSALFKGAAPVAARSRVLEGMPEAPMT